MNGSISTYTFLYNLYSTIHEYKISVQILMTKLLLKRFVLNEVRYCFSQEAIDASYNLRGSSFTRYLQPR